MEYLDDIAFESFLITSPIGYIIFLDGLPSNPKSKVDAIHIWNSMGYNIVFPRYAGTWESKGIFLKTPPQESIKKIAKFIRTNSGDIKIFLLGASFGGGVSLCVDEIEDITAVVAVSPVISYKYVPNINTLADYLRKEQGQNYRFEQKDFDNLIEDEICSPITKFSLNPKKVFIISGEKDEQIPFGKIKEFADNKNIRLYIDPDNGHITLSKLKPNHYELIDKFFKSFI